MVWWCGFKPQFAVAQYSCHVVLKCYACLLQSLVFKCEDAERDRQADPKVVSKWEETAKKIAAAMRNAKLKHSCQVNAFLLLFMEPIFFKRVLAHELVVVQNYRVGDIHSSIVYYLLLWDSAGNSNPRVLIGALEAKIREGSRSRITTWFGGSVFLCWGASQNKGQ